MNATVIFSTRAEKHVENTALQLAERSRKVAHEFVMEVGRASSNSRNS